MPRGTFGGISRGGLDVKMMKTVGFISKMKVRRVKLLKKHWFYNENGGAKGQCFGPRERKRCCALGFSTARAENVTNFVVWRCGVKIYDCTAERLTLRTLRFGDRLENKVCFVFCESRVRRVCATRPLRKHYVC